MLYFYTAMSSHTEKMGALVNFLANQSFWPIMNTYSGLNIVNEQNYFSNLQHVHNANKANSCTLCLIHAIHAGSSIPVRSNWTVFIL